MENVWAYLRSNKPAVSVFDTYEEILEKCAQAWNFFANDVNGGVKSGHWGGAKVGQFVECALGRVATNQQARSEAHWPSGRLFSCQVEGLAIRARL